MKRIILGTAGHIDHGKTTLIKALTGVDCDRLKEEKARGITIELGFTSLTLPGEQKVGIIDVPGHEKFVKNMVAGVGGIDGVMLVIAADEGVMPQTKEHLDICNLLSIRSGIIALTKSDLVDEEWLELVKEDVSGLVHGSFLEKAPIIPVSSATGSGIPDLLRSLEHLVAHISERPSSGIVRLPIDRVFTMKGFGTVLTGTLLAGKIAVGDEVEILPEKLKAKLRGIQLHNSPVDHTTAGQRTALNLQGIEKACVTRGDVICLPDTLTPTQKVVARFDLLKSAPRALKNRARVRFHSGTSEIMSRVVLLTADELQPGQNGYIQLLLESPAVLMPHDRYVIRSYSPVETIGGGEILDNRPPKHKRLADETRKRLETLKAWDATEVLLLFCREAGPAGLDRARIQSRMGMDPDKFHALTDKLLSSGAVVAFAKDPLHITLPAVVEGIKSAVTAHLKAYHARNPLKPGMVKEELRTKLHRDTDQRLYGYVIDRLVKKGTIKITNEFLSLPEHKPVLRDSQKGLKEKMLSLYKKGGKFPPTRKELVEKLNIHEKEAAGILGLLVRENTLVKLNEDIYYEALSLTRLVGEITDHAERHGELTIQSVKEQTGLTRKFLIPLFEYMDRSKITLRKGDKRVLKKPG